MSVLVIVVPMVATVSTCRVVMYRDRVTHCPLIVERLMPKNATINVDVRKWFLTSTGAVIDPSTATSGSTNLRLIESNIRRSFHAFEDDHERGEDRHEGHGSVVSY